MVSRIEHLYLEALAGFFLTLLAKQQVSTFNLTSVFYKHTCI